jgi:hypothetical protein
MSSTSEWAPLPRWTLADVGRFCGRGLLLAVVVYLVFRLPEAGLAGLVDSAAPYWFAKVLLDVLVLGYVAARSRWVGLKLVGALALVFAGLRTVSFVEIYLYEMIDAGELATGVDGTLVDGVVLALLVVVVFGRVHGEESPAPDDRLQLSPGEWVWKLTLLAAVFLLTMVLAGLVVFTGVGRVVDPVALANYDLLETPAWVLPFQLVRGLVFTALLLPVVYLLRGGLRETQLTVALLFAVLLSSNMLQGYDSVPGLLWIAHFAELFSQAFVYGLVAVPLLHHSHHPLARLLGSQPQGEM